MTIWCGGMLLADDRVTLSSFLHADAFIALYPFLTKVVVPRGVTDIAKDRPLTDVVLIATKASLVVRKDLHPAIQYLLENVQVQLMPTAGSVENLAMLRDPNSGVIVALIEGGILSA